MQQWLERNSFIKQFVSGELAKTYDEINKRLAESFNTFAPLIQNVSNELKTTNQNLVALGNAVENEGKTTRQQLLDDTNALGTQLENGQTQTRQLITDSTNALGSQNEQGRAQANQLITDATNALGSEMHTTNQNVSAIENGQAQLGILLTNGNNAIGSQLVDNQQAMVTREQLFQHLYEQNMREYQNLMDSIWQSYVNLMNQLQQQPMISLDDREIEYINTSGFTPQAIDQVNRATALTDAYEDKDSNSTKKEWERDDIREDFIAFSSLLARNFNNPYFAQFANNLGFYQLFNAYHSRNEEPILMNFFIRVANCKDLTPEYLNEMKEFIKRFDVVVDIGYEQYLRKTYNIIKDMFTANGFNG